MALDDLLDAFSREEFEQLADDIEAGRVAQQREEALVERIESARDEEITDALFESAGFTALFNALGLEPPVRGLGGAAQGQPDTTPDNPEPAEPDFNQQQPDDGGEPDIPADVVDIGGGDTGVEDRSPEGEQDELERIEDRLPRTEFSVTDRPTPRQQEALRQRFPTAQKRQEFERAERARLDFREDIGVLDFWNTFGASPSAPFAMLTTEEFLAAQQGRFIGESDPGRLFR